MLSVIIPTYQVQLEDIVKQLSNLVRQEEEIEVIFSDGESHYFSRFLDVISTLIQNSLISLKIIQNTDKHNILSRAQSLNLGALSATGDVLLFLHIDTLLPKNAIRKITEAMQDENNIAGCFLKSYDPPFTFQITKKILNYRTRLSKKMVGTNAMFVRSTIFKEYPFPEHFMEDLALSDALIKNFSKHRIVLIKDYVTVSSEKYLKTGAYKRIFINTLVLLLYRTGKVDHTDLEKLYKRSKGAKIPTLLFESCRLLKKKNN